MVLIFFKSVGWCFFLGCFRPLTGIMVLIAVLIGGNDPIYKVVSVPLRGLWFLSEEDIINHLIHYYVSVPLRGLWFLSGPIKKNILSDAIMGFRPLTGIMVLIGD